MSEKRWMVTGGSGQVGGAIRDLIAQKGWFPDRTEIDLANLPAPDQLAALLECNAVEIIINCAAYTAVDKAETEEALAFKVNGEAPGRLAAAAALRNIPIIHLSTDYVFSGDDKAGAWTETDPLGPINAYGRTKLAGEEAVRQSNTRHIIMRTAWVVSKRGSNFVKTMLRLATERSQLNIVGDQTGCPTSAEDIAQVVIAMGEKLMTKNDAPTGVYHFVNAGEASWYQLADFIFQRAGAMGHVVPALSAITTSEYPTPAKRPQNSVLSTEKFASDYQIMPRPWQVAVGEIVNDLLKGQTK